MSDNKYTLTIRAAAAWDDYIEPKAGIDRSNYGSCIAVAPSTN